MKFKSFFYIFFIILVLSWSLHFVYLYLTPHYTPKVKPVDLKPLLSKPSFSSEDYQLIFEQTGLSQPIVDELRLSADFEEQLCKFQRNYLADIKVYNIYMPPATLCQMVGSSPSNKVQAFTLAPYHNGYILFTDATHSFGLRHGHIGLVVDEIRGLTLEALSPGTVSCLQNIHKWEFYPTFKMLRLKDASPSLMEDISNYALAQLQGLPYNILSSKKQKIPYTTHCSLLVWQAFYPFGYDLDSTGGYFVLPQDIIYSPFLEVLQIYGLNPIED